jgi:hypothetical protein
MVGQRNEMYLRCFDGYFQLECVAEVAFSYSKKEIEVGTEKEKGTS